MPTIRNIAIAASGLSAVVVLAIAGQVMSQDAAPPGVAPSWGTLVRCAGMADEDARLACYDAAMRAAGFAPKPEAVAAERRKHFGLSIPNLNILRRQNKTEGATGEASSEPAKPTSESALPEDQDHISVELGEVARLYDGKLLLITTEGAIWEQTDTTQIQQPPKKGDTMEINRSKFGGYFCDVSKWKSVRCSRTK